MITNTIERPVKYLLALSLIAAVLLAILTPGTALAVEDSLPSESALNQVAPILEVDPASATNYLPGGEVHSFTVRLTQDGVPLSGYHISIATDFGVLDQTQGTTDDNGEVAFTVTSNIPGTAELRAKAYDEAITTIIAKAKGFKTWEMVPLDYGDLPDASSGGDPVYNLTRLVDDGARHVPGNLFLGQTIDGEPDGLPTQLSDGDDINNSNDEDGGVRLASPPGYWSMGEGRVEVTVSGGPGCLTAWIDFWDSDNNDVGTDGDFDDSDPGGAWSEVVINNQPANGIQVFSFPLPIDAATYPMYARFRLIPDADQDGTCSDQPAAELTGLVVNGEVEDYLLNFNATALDLQSFDARAAHPAQSALGGLALVVSSSFLLGGWLVRRKSVGR